MLVSLGLYVCASVRDGLLFLEQDHALPATLTDLQKRVVEAEATIGKKEEENVALRDQVKQFEARRLEYEAKMKSMEDMWQKQMASLQVSSHHLIFYAKSWYVRSHIGWRGERNIYYKGVKISP